MKTIFVAVLAMKQAYPLRKPVKRAFIYGPTVAEGTRRI